MRDQASILRNLIQRRSVDTPTSSSERARVVTFTSGKGGVGKSNLALNVAVAMAQAGERVCLLDANPGSSNLDVLCGLNSYWNFGHVLTGARSLSEVIVKGPSGINLLLAASQLADVSRTSELVEQIATLEVAYDTLLIDAGVGQFDIARRFANVADVTFVVTTPEPTAIADAYALVKSWHGQLRTMPDVLVNRATSATQGQQILERFAQTVETFLHGSTPTGCSIAEDCSVAQAVCARRPFVELSPDGAATRDVRAIAKRVSAGAKPVCSQSLIERL